MAEPLLERGWFRVTISAPGGPILADLRVTRDSELANAVRELRLKYPGPNTITYWASREGG